MADTAHELRTPDAIVQAQLDALEDGVHPLNVEQVRMLSELAQVVRDLSDRASARGMTLSLPAQPAATHIDPNRVQHARKRVEITVQPREGAVLLHVDDDGPGQPRGRLHALHPPGRQPGARHRRQWAPPSHRAGAGRGAWG